MKDRIKRGVLGNMEEELKSTKVLIETLHQKENCTDKEK
jgi:hypothetical protein